MTHLLIIGGSDAGISAALRAREVDSAVEVTVVVADAFPNYSICGLPFYLSGEVPEWQALAHRTAAEIEAQGITLRLNERAEQIDPHQHVVYTRDQAGQCNELAYGRLVIATGAVPIRPSLPGLDVSGVYCLHTMADSFAVHQHLTEQAPRSAIIIGGGYIGLEMADALTLRGLRVTLLQRGASVLKTLDLPLSQLVSDELEAHGVRVMTGQAVEGFERHGSQVQVVGTAGVQQVADLVLMAVGVQPDTALAQTAGVHLGERGALAVTRQMETNVEAIYAAGDCVGTWHRPLDRPTYLPLGTTAHKQGRVAGENAVGGQRVFAGSLGTRVVKVFELACARTGLTEAEARAAGFDPWTQDVETWDHKRYYPGATLLHLRVTADRQSGRLLGAQMVGHWQAEVAKRIDIFATALFHDMTIDALSDLDLSYTPPLSSPWDPVQVAAQAWMPEKDNVSSLTPQERQAGL
jgi:NADPH-dependent 2,4-dienoyl-CoA reductase/sulfur reductase-like enzyme